MAIIRRDPFDAFLGVQEDLNRMFRQGWMCSDEKGLVESGKWAPAIDIFETADSLVVEAELPGMDPSQIDVSIDDGVLVIKGERSHEKEVDEENYHRLERAYGFFQRSVRLPVEAVADEVKATYDAGVLRVSVPKAEPKEPRRVPVTIEASEDE